MAGAAAASVRRLAGSARRYGGSYPPVLGGAVAIIALLVAIVTWSGHEKKGADLSGTG